MNPAWLEKLTFVVEHNPNCPMPFMVRLVGHYRGMIDHLPFKDSKDCIGYGKTLDEAADKAKYAYDCKAK